MVLSHFHTPFIKTGISVFDEKINGLPINCIILIYKEKNINKNLFFHKILLNQTQKYKKALIYYYLTEKLKIFDDQYIGLPSNHSWQFYNLKVDNLPINIKESSMILSKSDFYLNLKKLIEKTSITTEKQILINNEKISIEKKSTSLKINTCINSINGLLESYGIDKNMILVILSLFRSLSRQLNGFTFFVLNNDGLMTNKDLRLYKMCKINEVFIEMIDESKFNLYYSTEFGRKEFFELEL